MTRAGKQLAVIHLPWPVKGSGPIHVESAVGAVTSEGWVQLLPAAFDTSPEPQLGAFAPSPRTASPVGEAAKAPGRLAGATMNALCFLHRRAQGPDQARLPASPGRKVAPWSSYHFIRESRQNPESPGC